MRICLKDWWDTIKNDVSLCLKRCTLLLCFPLINMFEIKFDIQPKLISVYNHLTYIYVYVHNGNMDTHHKHSKKNKWT